MQSEIVERTEHVTGYVIETAELSEKTKLGFLLTLEVRGVIQMAEMYNTKDPLIQSLKTRKLDELLDLYSFYLQTKLESVREEVIAKARDLAELDPHFQFALKELIS